LQFLPRRGKAWNRVYHPASILLGQHDLEKAEVPEESGHILVELALAIRFGRSRGYRFLRHPCRRLRAVSFVLRSIHSFPDTSPLSSLATSLMTTPMDFCLWPVQPERRPATPRQAMILPSWSKTGEAIRKTPSLISWSSTAYPCDRIFLSSFFRTPKLRRVNLVIEGSPIFSITC